MFSRIVYLISVGFFLFLVWENLGLIQDIVSDLSNFKYRFLFLALLLQFLKYWLLAYSFYINFKQVGAEFKFNDIFRETFVYLYLSIATPMVGAGGVLAFLNHAGKHNVSRAKVGAGALLALLTDYLSFLLLIFLSIIIFKDALEDFPTAYIVGILSIGIGLASVVFLALFQKNFLIKLFEIVMNLVNGMGRLFKKNPIFDQDWAQRNTLVAHECFSNLKKSPRFYLYSTWICFLSHVLNILTLGVVYWSLKENLSASKLTSTYIIINTLESVSPTPNGIGVVETLTPKYMSSLGLNFSNSLIIVSIFRFVYFYLPVLVGLFLSTRLFSRFRIKDKLKS